MLDDATSRASVWSLEAPTADTLPCPRCRVKREIQMKYKTSSLAGEAAWRWDGSDITRKYLIGEKQGQISRLLTIRFVGNHQCHGPAEAAPLYITRTLLKVT